MKALTTIFNVLKQHSEIKYTNITAITDGYHRNNCDLQQAQQFIEDIDDEFVLDCYGSGNKFLGMFRITPQCNEDPADWLTDYTDNDWCNTVADEILK